MKQSDADNKAIMRSQSTFVTLPNCNKVDSATSETHKMKLSFFQPLTLIRKVRTSTAAT